MKPNLIAVLVATLVPVLLGFFWYNTKFGFGKAWMASSDMTEEKAKKTNMALVFGLTLLFSLFLAFGLQSIVIHQYGVGSILMMEPDFAQEGSPSSAMMHDFMEKYGHSHRTFGHGLFHGILAGIMIALPLIGINALFEARSFRYIAINSGFWIVCMGFMGGILCAWI